jgi:hypothetical protein
VYIVDVRQFLSEETVPSDEKEKADLIGEADKFVIQGAFKPSSEGVLHRKIRGVTVLYIEVVFRKNLM